MVGHQMRQARPRIRRLQATPGNHLSGDLDALYRGRFGVVRHLDHLGHDHLSVWILEW